MCKIISSSYVPNDTFEHEQNGFSMSVISICPNDIAVGDYRSYVSVIQSFKNESWHDILKSVYESRGASQSLCNVFGMELEGHSLIIENT